MLIVVALIVVVGAIRGIRRRASEARTQAEFDAYAETVDLVLASLRAGYSLSQSILMLADVAPKAVRSEFADIRSRVEAGCSVTACLSDSGKRLDTAFRSLVSLVGSSIRLGIPTESAIVQIQADARNVRRHRSDVRARQLSVRLTLPLVLCALPSFSFLVIIPMIAGTITQLRSNGG